MRAKVVDLKARLAGGDHTLNPDVHLVEGEARYWALQVIWANKIFFLKVPDYQYQDDQEMKRFYSALVLAIEGPSGE